MSRLMRLRPLTYTFHASMRHTYTLDHQQITRIKFLLNKQRYSAVIDLCENKIQQEGEEDISECLDAIYFRAYAHSKLGQMGEALNDIEYLVFVHDPKNIHGMILKANVLRVLNQIDEATDLYEKVLSRDPNNPVALHSMAKYYLSKYCDDMRVIKNRPEIAHTFEKVLKMDDIIISENNQALDDLLTKGLIAQTLGRYDEAQKHFDKMLEMDPNNDQAKLYQMICMVLNNNLERSKEAISHFNTLLKKNPNDRLCLYYKSVALKNLSKYKDAIETLQKLAIISPMSYEAYNLMGQIYAIEKQHFDAIECFDKAIQFNSDDTTSWKLKAVALYNVGIYDESLECLDYALDLEKSNSNILLAKLYVLAEMRKWKELLENCEIILSRDPNNERANYFRLQAISLITQK